jgi:hypothetical protein
MAVEVHDQADIAVAVPKVDFLGRCHADWGVRKDPIREGSGGLCLIILLERASANILAAE